MLSVLEEKDRRELERGTPGRRLSFLFGQAIGGGPQACFWGLKGVGDVPNPVAGSFKVPDREELQSLLEGNSILTTHRVGTKHYRPDGSFVRLDTKDRKEKGTWRVVGEGYYCETTAAFRFYLVAESKRRPGSHVNIGRTMAAIPVHTYKFAKGDPKSID
ncbi:MAG: hypothetical protein CL569_04110 [Alphaproteobacteria bacterium]|nr:hypothetical protein [Alphaproteobacteria bacterium]